jgi:pyridinium-3,5-bisthiocarboxylic acid mononucleotide nickel chelatase
MKYAYFDASSGLSGDMILGALLDLGASRPKFQKAIASLKLPVRLKIYDVERSHLRGLKVDVDIIHPTAHARHWSDIERFIKKAPLDAAVKERGLVIFKNLFSAEAKVHGEPFDHVHLHEAGADDALVDVLGAAWLIEELGIGEVYCSPLNVGSGWVKTSHGVLPVPPPAVAELLKDVPVYSAQAQAELVTPTGAAIIKTLAAKFLSLPELTYDKIGCGAGGRDTPGLPNILRVFSGERSTLSPAKRVYLIEATIDDANPQILAVFIDRALELGALDATLTPIIMKKNRLATKLTVVAELAKLDRLITAIFEETTSIGVRYFPVERRAMERTIETVRVLGESVRIKTASLGGRMLNAQPEFDDALALARKKGLPLKEVLRRASAAHLKPHKD